MVVQVVVEQVRVMVQVEQETPLQFLLLKVMMVAQVKMQLVQIEAAVVVVQVLVVHQV